MAERPPFSRWRRLPPVFRTGENRPIGSGKELDRIILYLPTQVLDLAETLAQRAGIPVLQEYCERLLTHAIEEEHLRLKVARFESRRAADEGIHEIEEDPDYRSEWQGRVEASSTPLPQPPGDALAVDLVLADGDESQMLPGPVNPDEVEGEAHVIHDAESPAIESVVEAEPVQNVRLASDRSALEVLARHVGQGNDELGFLPCLRRGMAVPRAKITELIHALTQLESDLRGVSAIERGLAHALHRLALESQVLLTDAWPGAFDGAMIAAIRSVQEAVERVLSGQDIRYYPSNAAAPAASEPSP